MTKFVSRRGVLGLAIEATRGTPVAPTYWFPWASMKFHDTTEEVREEQGLGNIADSDSKYVTLRMGQGDVDAQVYDQGLGYILSSLLGTTPSTSGSGTYTHTFTLSQTNQTKTLSIYWQDPDRNYMFAKSVVESLHVTVDPRGFVQFTIGFKSMAAKDWATLTPNFTTLGSKFVHQHLQYRLASNIAGLSGATALSLKNLDFTISRNAIFDDVLGTVEPEDILSQSISVEGSLTLNLEDDTYRNYMLAGTYKAQEIKFLGSSSSSWTLQMPRVDFSAWEPDLNLNEIAKQNVNFKANYDSANALQIISTCTLVNTKSSY